MSEHNNFRVNLEYQNIFRISEYSNNVGTLRINLEYRNIAIMSEHNFRINLEYQNIAIMLEHNNFKVN